MLEVIYIAILSSVAIVAVISVIGYYAINFICKEEDE